MVAALLAISGAVLGMDYWRRLPTFYDYGDGNGVTTGWRKTPADSAYWQCVNEATSKEMATDFWFWNRNAASVTARVDTAYPNAVGDISQWTASSGTAKYDLVDEVTCSATDYVYALFGSKAQYFLTNVDTTVVGTTIDSARILGQFYSTENTGLGGDTVWIYFDTSGTDTWKQSVWCPLTTTTSFTTGPITNLTRAKLKTMQIGVKTRTAVVEIPQLNCIRLQVFSTSTTLLSGDSLNVACFVDPQVDTTVITSWDSVRVGVRGTHTGAGYKRVLVLGDTSGGVGLLSTFYPTDTGEISQWIDYGGNKLTSVNEVTCDTVYYVFSSTASHAQYYKLTIDTTLFVFQIDSARIVGSFTQTFGADTNWVMFDTNGADTWKKSVYCPDAVTTSFVTAPITNLRRGQLATMQIGVKRLASVTGTARLDCINLQVFYKDRFIIDTLDLRGNKDTIYVAADGDTVAWGQTYVPDYGNVDERVPENIEYVSNNGTETEQFVLEIDTAYAADCDSLKILAYGTQSGWSNDTTKVQVNWDSLGTWVIRDTFVFVGPNGTWVSKTSRRILSPTKAMQAPLRIGFRIVYNTANGCKIAWCAVSRYFSNNIYHTQYTKYSISSSQIGGAMSSHALALMEIGLNTFDSCDTGESLKVSQLFVQGFRPDSADSDHLIFHDSSDFVIGQISASVTNDDIWGASTVRIGKVDDSLYRALVVIRNTDSIPNPDQSYLYNFDSAFLYLRCKTRTEWPGYVVGGLVNLGPVEADSHKAGYPSTGTKVAYEHSNWLYRNAHDADSTLWGAAGLGVDEDLDVGTWDRGEADTTTWASSTTRKIPIYDWINQMTWTRLTQRGRYNAVRLAISNEDSSTGRYLDIGNVQPFGGEDSSWIEMWRTVDEGVEGTSQYGTTTAILGSNTPNITNASLLNRIQGGSFVMPYDGTFDTISAYIRQVTSTADQVKCAIYNVNTSSKTLLANGETSEKTITSGTTAWHKFLFPGTKPVGVKGKHYFLAAWGTNNGVSLNLNWGAAPCVSSVDSVADTMQGYATSITYGAWPDPLGGTVLPGRRASIYASYTPTPPAVIPSTAGQDVVCLSNSSNIENFYVGTIGSPASSGTVQSITACFRIASGTSSTKIKFAVYNYQGTMVCQTRELTLGTGTQEMIPITLPVTINNGNVVAGQRYTIAVMANSGAWTTYARFNAVAVPAKGDTACQLYRSYADGWPVLDSGMISSQLVGYNIQAFFASYVLPTGEVQTFGSRRRRGLQ